MDQRPLGSQGLTVSAQGLGCMGMSEFYGATDEAESIATIHRALELGVTLLDTADVYGPYKNEELVGRAVRGRRDRVVIATKFGIVRDPDDRRPAASTAGPSTCAALRGVACGGWASTTSTSTTSTASTRTCRSRRRWARWPSWSRAGKVRYLGLSEAAAATVRRAHAVHPITALQTEYSLWTPRPRGRACCPPCRELGIGFVAYSPLGRGFLTGADPDARGPGAGRLPALLAALPGRQLRPEPRAGRTVERSGAGQGRRRRPSSRWPGCCAQGEDVVPIPGHQAPQLPRGERRRDRDRADAGRAGRAGSGRATRRSGGRSLRRHVSAEPVDD